MLPKTKLIKVYEKGLLNEFGKDKLIDKFIKEEEKRKRENQQKGIKKMKRTIRRKSKWLKQTKQQFR